MNSENEKRISFRKIRNVAWIEYVKWLCNSRNIVFFVLNIFIYDYVIKELLNAAQQMNEYIMILEPFIAITNSELMIMVIPATFIVLMSDYPKTDGNTMFYIQRAGKKNWMLGQFLFGLMSAFSYLIGIFFISIVCVSEKAYAKNTWSNVITQYTKKFPNKSLSKVPLLINGRLYNNMTPLHAFFLTTTLIFLYLWVIEVLLMLGFSLGKRIVGMLIGFTIIGVGSSLCNISNKMKWAFPSAHSIVWLHFDRVLKFQKFSIKYSYIYFTVLIFILSIISYISIEHYDFANVTDMED